MTGIFRAALLGVVCLASLAADNGRACAADYPNRPVHWLIGFAAGGPVDIVARIMGQWLSERLGQQFVVENRAGSGGNLDTVRGAVTVNGKGGTDTVNLLDQNAPFNDAPAVYWAEKPLR